MNSREKIWKVSLIVYDFRVNCKASPGGFRVDSNVVCLVSLMVILFLHSNWMQISMVLQNATLASTNVTQIEYL